MDRSGARASLALVAVFGVVYAILSTTSFQRFPFSGDEYSAYLQAEIFAEGSLSVPAPAHAPLFYVDHVIFDDRVRSKYPPGASALLALGMLVGAPWLVGPLEGALALALVRRIARTTFGDPAALLAVFIVGISPLFMFNAASFYSHAPVTLWLTLALAALLQGGGGTPQADGRRRWFVLAGGAIGLAFLTRPFDAMVFAAAVPFFGRWRRVLPWTALGALPGPLVTLLYQRAQFGGAFVDGYRLYAPTFREIYGPKGAGAALRLAYLVDPDQSWQHFERLRAFVADWMPPGVLVAFTVGALLVPRQPPGALPLRNFVLGLVGITIASFLPTWVMDDDGPAPRYLSQLVVPVALLAAPGVIALDRALTDLVGAGWSRATGILLASCAVVMFVAVATVRLPKVWEREGLYVGVKERELHGAVILVKAKHPTRYTRNGPRFDGSVIYVRPGLASIEEIGAWFPGRRIFEATEGWKWGFTLVGQP